MSAVVSIATAMTLPTAAMILSTTTAVALSATVTALRCCMACVGTRSATARWLCVAVIASAPAIAAIGNIARSAVIAPSAFTHEAMPAPAVAVAPATPRTHAQEDAVVEIARPVITHRRALVRCVTVVAVCTARLNADVNRNLRLCCRRQGHAHNQCCCSEENFKSAHVTPFKVSAVPCGAWDAMRPERTNLQQRQP